MYDFEDDDSQFIVKSNELIQKCRYSLTLWELQTLSFIISKIDSSKVEFSTIRFYLSEIFREMDIDAGGKHYKKLKNIILDLRNNGFWVKLDNSDEEVTVSFVSEAIINPNTGLVQIEMNKRLMPFFLQLKESTTYSAKYPFAVGSVYSIPLYELLKSYLSLGKWTVDVEVLKTQLNAHNYKDFSEFNRNVLKKAINEINEITDIFVSYKPRIEQKKYTQLTFQIEQKKELL